MENIRFVQQQKTNFAAALRKNVNKYFKDNNISQKADYRYGIKVAAMLGMYLAPFAMLLTMNLAGWLQIILCFIMGVGLAGVGMSVMHDAAHGSVSHKDWVNKMLASSMYILGGNVFTWKLQHNVLHHTYTNIHGMDDDIRDRPTLRLSPHSPFKKHHRYQHIYALFLYGLMTLSIVLRDFIQLREYNKSGLTERQKASPGREYAIMLVSKIFYFSLFLGLPFFVTDYAWWQIVTGFMIVHFTGGLIMAMIFQLAHVVEHAEHPEPGADGNIDNEWMIHQLETTVDFAPKSKILGWYIGGLNYQVEHHLFPHISHVHYPEISKIVEDTAREHNVTYNSIPTFFSAFRSHLRMLKQLGYDSPEAKAA